MSNDIYGIWRNSIMVDCHHIFKSSNKLLIIKLIHKLEITLKHLIQSTLSKLLCKIILENLFESTCSMKLNRQRLLIVHVLENSIYNLSQMVFIFEFHVTVGSISLAGA